MELHSTERTYTNKLSAVQLTEEDGEKIEVWCNGELRWSVLRDGSGETLMLFDSMGTKAYATLGDWIVRDERGDFYALSDEALHKHFEIAKWHREEVDV